MPKPTDIFTLDYFRTQPEPFYLLAQELFPGNYCPTLTHTFIKLLHSKNILLRCYTQNIDSLEREAGVPGEALVEAHGTFASAHCINPQCKKQYTTEFVKSVVFGTNDTGPGTNTATGSGGGGDAKSAPAADAAAAISTTAAAAVDVKSTPDVKSAPAGSGGTSASGKPAIPKCTACGSTSKPDIVFFGEELPERFIKCSKADFPKCDLLIVSGTSLLVMPFAGLINRVPKTCRRVVINRESVGESIPGSFMGMTMGDEPGFTFSDTVQRLTASVEREHKKNGTPAPTTAKAVATIQKERPAQDAIRDVFMCATADDGVQQFVDRLQRKMGNDAFEWNIWASQFAAMDKSLVEEYQRRFPKRVARVKIEAPPPSVTVAGSGGSACKPDSKCTIL